MNSDSPNPYAPVMQGIQTPNQEPPDAVLWRQGNLLVCRNNSRLPPYCLRTGKYSRQYFPVYLIWQPWWTYLFMLPLLLPYLVVSPILRKDVELQVAIDNTTFRLHRRMVWAGIGCFLAGFAIFVTGALLATLFNSGPLAGLAIVLCGLLITISIFLCGRNPARIHIQMVKGDFVYLRNVHPKLLQNLPEY